MTHQQSQDHPEPTGNEVAPQLTGRTVNIAPTPEGQQHMANLFAEQHVTSQEIIDRANALVETIETEWLDGLVAQLRSEDGYEALRLIKEGLGLVVSQEETRIKSMQNGLNLLADVEVFPKSTLRRRQKAGQ